MLARVAADRWRRELALWLNHLDDKLRIETPPLPNVQQMTDLWMVVDVRNTGNLEPLEWTRTIQALELLDLLVRLDPEVGWDIVFSLNRVRDEDVYRVGRLLPRRQACLRFVLLFSSHDLRRNPQSVFLAIRQLLGEDVGLLMPEPTEFLRVQQLLLDEWKNVHHCETFDRAKHGRIQVKLEFPLPGAIPSELLLWITHQITAVADTNENLISEPPVDNTVESHAQPQPRKSPFVCAGLEIEFDRHVLDANPATIALLQLTVTKTLPITKLVVDDYTFSRMQGGLQAMLLRNMCGVWMDDDRGIESLELRGHFNEKQVAALASAIAHSQGIRDFRLVAPWFDPSASLDGSVYGYWWPWLAYALFCRNATHCVQRVTLEVYCLDLATVSLMRQILEHDDPLSLLCSLDVRESDRHVNTEASLGVILKPGTCVTLGHWSENDRSRSADGDVEVTETQLLPITQVHRGKGIIEILLPGAGVAWVERSGVIEVKDFPRRDKSPIQYLCVDYIENDDVAVVVELLRLVGGDLTELELCGDTAVFSDSFMEGVCSACPRLRILRVSGQLQTLDWLHSSAMSVEPRCRPESLVIEAAVVDHTSFRAFFKALSDDLHPFTRTLRGLHIDTCGQMRDRELKLSEVATHWATMLHANTRLERCVLVYKEPASIKGSTERYYECDGDPIYTAEAIAFLSVLRSSPHEIKRPRLETPLARHRINIESIVRILSLAGVPLTRICA